MTLDERLALAARQVADGVTPPEVDLEAVRAGGRARRQRVVAAASLSVLLAAAVTAVIIGWLTSPSSRPEPVERPLDGVPTTTQRVYLVVQPWASCGFVDEAFTPLIVEGPGYRTTVPATDGCQVRAPQTIGFNVSTYAFDVPMPSDGTVTLTAGGQPPTALDAARVTRRGGATVTYTLVEFGVYQTSFIKYGGRIGIGVG